MFNQITFITGLLFILLGFNTGILSGFFGVGGCFILTPLLNILGLPMAQAIGTGLFFAVIVSSWAGVKHFIAGNALIKVSIIIGLLSFAGIQISQPLVLYLDSLKIAGLYIRLLYILLLVTLGLLTIKKKVGIQEGKNINNNSPKFLTFFKNMPPRITIEKGNLPISIWPIVVIALTVGCLQGFLGVG